MRTAKSMPVPPNSRGTVIHGTSMSSPFHGIEAPHRALRVPRMRAYHASTHAVRRERLNDALAEGHEGRRTRPHRGRGEHGHREARRRAQQDGRQPAEDAQAEEESASALLVPYAGERQVAQDRAGSETDH